MRIGKDKGYPNRVNLNLLLRSSVLGLLSFNLMSAGASANPPPEPATIKELALASNQFGFKLIQALWQGTAGENLLISPYSIFTALGMTYNGAGGATQMAMANCLEITGIHPSRLNPAALELKNRLSATPKVELLIANSLWARKGITFNSKFLQTNQRFYQAEMTNLDFSSPQAPVYINNWVKENTKGKITGIIDNIKPEAVLFLINAVYFKGRWQEEFDPKLTQERDFNLPNGTKKLVKMMSRSDRFNYFANEKFQAVELPYGDGKMSLFIFLPTETPPEKRGRFASGTEGLIQFFTELSSVNWEKWLSEFHSVQGELFLPRFKLEYKTSLTQPLKKLGMDEAFDLTRADFSLMAKGNLQFAIGDVLHKTFIEVNEEGTEAAAVTSVEMVLSAIPTDRFRMVVDRPFFFAIQENETRTILFMGVVVEP